MNHVQRVKNTLNFLPVEDRLPMMEWAGWWDKTLTRFREEGAPKEIPKEELREYLGLDMFRQFWISPKTNAFIKLSEQDQKVSNKLSYELLKPILYGKDAILLRKQKIESLVAAHDKGDCVVWLTLEGFFWFPRTLFGIEEHFYAFYDEPELMHEINQDLVDYNIFLIEEFCKLLRPEFMTFAEDMSYNLGPMLSEAQFDEFLLPYYKQVVPILKKYDIIPMIDTDGQLEPMIPWLKRAGIEGALPLERQAGVDVSNLRKNHPDFKIIGAYDKMVMKNGEQAMRNEFERILPVMKMGGYIPSVDHQTPPDVSLENYKIYVNLLREYCEKAVKE
ncbi:MAG: hypothetical protein KAG94_04615 [Clostridiales bacterium]|nr:hypothetical protein [Clostridiales bacterium]